MKPAWAQMIDAVDYDIKRALRRRSASRSGQPDLFALPEPAPRAEPAPVEPCPECRVDYTDDAGSILHHGTCSRSLGRRQAAEQ